MVIIILMFSLALMQKLVLLVLSVCGGGELFDQSCACAFAIGAFNSKTVRGFRYV